MATRRADRNRRIREEFANGRTMQDIADEFGLSRQRIDQIVQHEKQRAREVFKEAIRRGDLERADECDRCGAPDPHGHHPDYSDPLTVEWLCAKCHGIEHADDHRVPLVRFECEYCGEVEELRPCDATDRRYCSVACRGAANLGEIRVERSERVAEAAVLLSRYATRVGYIPGTTEFAMHATGKKKSASIPIMCDQVDPGHRQFGSYAGVMDAVYEAAGFPRPKYGSLPLFAADKDERFVEAYGRATRCAMRRAEQSEDTEAA